MYIGHYLLDWPIHLLIRLAHRGHYNPPDFTKAMAAGLRSPFGGFLTTIGGYYQALTEPMPRQMKGPFGFLLGAIPQIIRHVINLIGEAISCIPHFLADKLCDAIRNLYNKIGARLHKKKLPDPNAPQTPAPGATPHATPSSPKPAPASGYRRPAGRGANQQANPGEETPLTTVMKAGEDLFALLGISADAFMKDRSIAAQQFKTLSRTQHPDKSHPPKPDEDEAYKAGRVHAQDNFHKLTRARNILVDTAQADQYLRWYSQRYNPTLFGNSGSAPNNVTPLQPVPIQTPSKTMAGGGYKRPTRTT